MRFAALCILVFGLFSAASSQDFYGSTDVKLFREGRDKEFRNRKESPLKDEEFATFKGLNYFPVDKRFRVKAVFTLTPSEKYFQMPTSSGGTRKFVKHGILKFKLGGAERTLSVYQTDAETLAKYPEYADLLFVPFKDSTSKTETYGGGRYMDIRLPKQGNTVILDFNVAYNPNCAYGSFKYSCPLPPSENTLNVAIKAGEKRFAHSGPEQ